MVVSLLELSKKRPFEDGALSLEAARCAARDNALVHDRITVEEYACLVVHRSAQHYEGIALARVAPKVRRDALALDAEEDRRVRRLSTEHCREDFNDAEDGNFADEMVADIDRTSCPVKLVDACPSPSARTLCGFCSVLVSPHPAVNHPLCEGLVT